MNNDTLIPKSMEKWSPILFLLAGAVLLIFGALLGVEAFSDMTMPEDPFGLIGQLIAFIGLTPGLQNIAPGWRARAPSLQRSASSVPASCSWH